MHTNQLACKRHPHSVRIWMIFLAAVLGSLTEKCKFLINITYFVKLKNYTYLLRIVVISPIIILRI